MISTRLDPKTALTAISTPQLILQAALAGLSEGKISEVVDHFDTFVDHALTLEFADKRRLTEFFEKARELFPDTVVEVVSIFECGDYAISEWKLSATQIVPYGSISYRFPIVLPGSTIVPNRQMGRLLRPKHISAGQVGCVFHGVG